MNITKGDAYELIKTIPDNSVDLVLTDPPYGQTYNKWDKRMDLGILNEFWRVLKPTGTMLIFAIEPFASKLRLADKDYTFDFIWKKPQGTNFLESGFRPMRDFENILCFQRKPMSCKYNRQYRPAAPDKARQGTPTDNLAYRTERERERDAQRVYRSNLKGTTSQSYQWTHDRERERLRRLAGNGLTGDTGADISLPTSPSTGFSKKKKSAGHETPTLRERGRIWGRTINQSINQSINQALKVNRLIG